MTSKKLTEANVLEAYRAARQLKPAEFARELGMSKQSYSAYVNNGARQDLAGLQETAVKNVGTWIGDLAVDLLKVRRAAVPCLCQTEMFDNGPCPLHGPHSTNVVSSIIREEQRTKKGHWVRSEPALFPQEAMVSK